MIFTSQLSAEGPVLVMALADGNLTTRSDSFRGGDPWICTAAREIARALDYCRDQRLAHRDVKPDNILVDSSQNLYLSDFGLAAAIDDDEKWTQPIGAKPFLAPELLTKVSANEQSGRSKVDQFSFGVTLYLLLTGAFPHPQESSNDTAEWDNCTAYRLIRGHDIVPCSQRNPRIPSRADGVLRRMLCVDPDDRYPSNIAAADALNQALSAVNADDIRVFLSYSREDRSVAQELFDVLNRRGFRPWWDPKIEFGTVWEDAVEAAMDDCEIMLLVLSSSSIASQEVKNEWRYWLIEQKKPLITVVLDQCRIPYRLFPRQHIYAHGRPIEDVTTDISAAIRNAMAVFRPPAEQVQPLKLFSSKLDTPSLSMVEALKTLYVPALSRLVAKAVDMQYVQERYRVTSIPSEISEPVTRTPNPQGEQGEETGE